MTNIFVIPVTVLFLLNAGQCGGLMVNNSIVTSYSLGVFLYDNSTKCGDDAVTCVRKCCDVDYHLRERRCVLSNDTDLDVHIFTGREEIDRSIDYITGMIKCESGFYKLEPEEFSDDLFYIQKNGSLWKPVTEEMLTFSDYCLDNLAENTTSVFVCFRADEFGVILSRKMNAVGMIISMPFLLLTFLVYAILPDRNLHGKCLMCYVITLFGAYALLVFIQLYPDDLDEGCCKALGIFCLFFFMVSFFWMNVMSIDIWWAFSGLRGFSGSRKEAERKRFILYCSYAWGMPMLLALVVTSLTVSDVEKNTWYNPGMGDGQCWFRDGAPTLVYFYGPMATLIIANITLFCITACKIKQVQQDTAMLRKDESKKHTYENDKQRFNLYLKLMLAMGVNWAMEIISWIVDWQVGHVPPAVWYITDFCNALYGVFVFFIFVFKQNIWKLLKRRYYMTIGKPHLARSMTQTTAYSPRTTGSSLNHNISTDKTFVTDSSVLTSEVA